MRLRKFGITPKKLGKEEYEKKMLKLSLWKFLTDSNFHTEARWLVDLEGKPELREKPDYPSIDDKDYDEKIKQSEINIFLNMDNVDDDAYELGVKSSQESGWAGFIQSKV